MREQPGSLDGAWLSARFRNPWGVAVEPDGDVVVADSSNDSIRKLTKSGMVFTLAGQPGTIGCLDGYGDNAQFNNPYAVAEDAAGNIYVSDTGNGVIRKITPSRVVSTLAGLAGNVGSADGNGAAARFWNPQGLAVDGTGNVYVADTGNNLIRKISPMGQVTTIAGLAGSGRVRGRTQARQARFNGPAGSAPWTRMVIFTWPTRITKFRPQNHPDRFAPESLNHKKAVQPQMGAEPMIGTVTQIMTKNRRPSAVGQWPDRRNTRNTREEPGT